MTLELRQNLKLTQQLVMTPQLQQAIKLLQMSRLELIETIKEELETNPVLEDATTEEQIQPQETDYKPTDLSKDIEIPASKMPSLGSVEEQKTPWESKALDEVDWREYLDDDKRGVLQSYSFEEKEGPNYENLLTRSFDLFEHLIWQLNLSDLDDDEKRIGCLILGNINEDGYLEETVEALAQELEVSINEVEFVLSEIQQFDPVGVGARDIRECLLIQLKYLGIDNPIVIDLIKNHMHHIERANFQAICKATGIPPKDIMNAIKIISGLEPKPGRSYNIIEPHYVVPDIYVYKVGEEFVVSLNDEGLPRLKLSSYYKNSIEHGDASKEAKEFLQDKIRSASWLIKSIDQRKKTIFRVTSSIVKFQHDFFEKGVQFLKPLVLRDVAEEVELHESTVSRVTTNKYVQTPQGLFELKFFFSASIHKEDGDDMASQAVKEKIRLIIQGENTMKPYSDQAIVKILEEENIQIARRTVAKYREMMGILPSSSRKRLNLK